MNDNSGACEECDPEANKAWNSADSLCECNAATSHFVNPDNAAECILCDSNQNKKLLAGLCVCDSDTDFFADANGNCVECSPSGDSNRTWNSTDFSCDCDVSNFYYPNPENTSECILCDSTLYKKLNGDNTACVCDLDSGY
jgi:Tfp pilus assembly protein PilV